MKTTDKVLIGIVAGIILLIILALVMTLSKPAPEYQVDNTPEGVAHNYLLALQKEEYERAYSYLSPKLSGYPPTLDRFTIQVSRNSWSFRLTEGVTLSVESAKITGNTAIVTVHESRFREGDLFDSGQTSNTFNMNLRFENGEWKIYGSPYYFVWCWGYEKGCGY